MTTPPPVFIAATRKILTGPEAEQALAERNDRMYLDASRGVVQVDRGRWIEAQSYERKTWMEDFRTVADDRNRTHMECFGGYAALAGRSFEDAIELGCGPFTNLRLIASVCSISSASLLDPLINDYLSHPNCTYPDRRLRTAAGEIPIVAHASTIEDFQDARPYPLTVMINVIEHCYDYERLERTLLACAADWLVFHDRYYHAGQLSDSLTRDFDAGHPLKVDRRVIDTMLSKNFDEAFRAVVRVERNKWGGDRSYDGVYFIGRRKR